MYRLFLFFLLIPQNIYSQISEDWNNKYFSNSPGWQGDTIKFTIDCSQQLISLNAESIESEAFIYTNNSSINNAIWEFSVQLDFNPSSNNYCKIFLCCNQPEINETQTGYYVMIGNTEDEISLYRSDGDSYTEIIDGTDKTLDQSSNEISVKVTRTEGGNWVLYSKINDELYLEEGSINDDTYCSSSYFILYCKYTSTRSTKFHFGTIEVTGDAYIDNTPPYLEHYNIPDNKHIELTFSEAIDSTQISANNFLIQPQNITPSSIITNNKEITLNLASELDDTHEGYIHISSIPDLNNNISADTTITFQYFNHYRGDIVINEIMYDPTPTISTYSEEYIEIYNTTDHLISLEGWNLVINEKEISLPSDTIESNSYALITESEDIYTQTDIPIQFITISNLPNLTNTGSSIVLVNNDNQICDAFQYPVFPQPDEDKEDGGWSLERIDPINFNTSGLNWDFSIDEDGGTPGYINSIYQTNEDIVNPTITKLLYINDSTYSIYFDEMLDTSAINRNEFLTIEGYKLAEIQIDSVYLSQIQFSTNKKIPERTILSLLFNESITDKAGNFFSDNTNWKIGSPEVIDTFDISLNEILFNPVSGGEDFIEIYNRSDKTFLLNEIFLMNLSQTNPDEIIQGESENKLLFPGDYYVFTADTATLSDLHSDINQRNISECDLPSMGDESGNIVVCNSESKIIDHFEYDESIQYSMLNSSDGVSLEKINYNYNSNNINNWHSAATTYDYSTPTKINSQFVSEGNTEDSPWLWLSSKDFSPDEDGVKDNVEINYKVDSPGWTGHIAIYDRSGRRIKTILNNGLIGTNGTLKWDGTLEDGSNARIGIYIIYAVFVNSEGISKQKKLTAILTKS